MYAIFAQTSYYEQLETLALVFFVAPSPFVVYIGEKLQEYKKLPLPQREELVSLGQRYPEIKIYCDPTTKSNRQLIRGEYEACQAWVEEVNQQAE